MELLQGTTLPEIWNMLCDYPTRLIRYVEAAVLEVRKSVIAAVLLSMITRWWFQVQRRMVTSASQLTQDLGEQVKTKIHGRIKNLPVSSEFRKRTISALRSCDVGRFIEVSGTVIRTGQVSYAIAP